MRSKAIVGPKARAEDLIVREVRSETLVYDLKRDKAHCLNQTASMIWQRCNGKRTLAELVTILKKDFKTPIDGGIIELALYKLDKVHLIDWPSNGSTSALKRSRRDVLKKLGWAAVVTLPMVTTIVAPTAVMAASCPAAIITPAQCNAATVGCCCQQNATTTRLCREIGGGNFNCTGGLC